MYSRAATRGFGGHRRERHLSPLPRSLTLATASAVSRRQHLAGLLRKLGARVPALRRRHTRQLGPPGLSLGSDLPTALRHDELLGGRRPIPRVLHVVRGNRSRSRRGHAADLDSAQAIRAAGRPSLRGRRGAALVLSRERGGRDRRCAEPAVAPARQRAISARRADRRAGRAYRPRPLGLSRGSRAPCPGASALRLAAR